MGTYFTDKVVWVTGASSGIGEELCKQLDNQQAQLILSARNTEKLEVLNSQLTPGKHLVMPLDLAKSDSFQSAVDEVIKRFGRIDVLINNGGLSQRATASETSLDIDRQIMEINYFGNVALTKTVLPYMRKQGGGQFVVLSSIAGKFGFYLRSAYSASKHALHGFYESLALEEASNNVFVTLVCPGKINTNISMHALNASGEQHGVMDHNQETGMPVDQCVQQILKATQNKNKEVLIGNKEILAVYIKRFFPRLFWRIIKKQSAT